MKKQSLFYIFKFESDRIKHYEYSIELTVNQARKNGELVSVAQNQVILSILKMRGIKFDSDYLYDLFYKRKHLRKKQGNYQELMDVEKEIDGILFIPEIVSVSMTAKKDYDKIIQNGFKVNGENFVRLLCGSGHARRNTVIFCQQKIEKELKEILNNGRKIDEMVLAKNNAYFALSYSGTLPVSQPYFCVIPDCEIKRKEKVDVIHENNTITTEERELSLNLFDGQGIISPRLAQQWAEEIELDYIPSAFIIRNSFLKGMVCTVDFHKFSEEVAEKHFIKDVWGNTVNLRDMDLILTASQFKAWNQYSSMKDYIDNCSKNNFSFGISRVSPKFDNVHVFSNYQFLQVLDLNDSQIEKICSKTVNFFEKVTKNENSYTLLYLLGKMCSQEYDPDIYKKIGDNISKALILNDKMIDDPYIRNHIIRSINKKIKESYIGNLIFDGNYSFIIQDPYAFMEFMLELPVHGLLERGQHFNGFWNDRKTRQVAAMRAPLTWRSEVNILNLKDDFEVNDWYQYLRVGCTIFNVNGCDMALLADADSDGDLCMTTNQQEFIDGAFGGLPVYYEKKKASKSIVKEDKLWEVDKLSFDSRIGYITNCSTTLYSMLNKFDSNSVEAKEIIARLKICRRLQGDQIDLAKGIEINPFPSHWVKWNKESENMSQEEANFNNSIIIDKRPYFMKYLYQDYAKEYNKFLKNYDTYSIANFGKSFDKILSSSERTLAEDELVQKYIRFSPLLDSNCVMNKICHHMEKQIKPLTAFSFSNIDDHVVFLMKNHSIEITKEKIKLVYDLYKKYKKGKQNLSSFKNEHGEDRFKTIDQYSSFIRTESYSISTDITELATLAVTICYELHKNDSKSFAWDVFGEGILLNISKNSEIKQIPIPFLDRRGDIEYLGNYYSLRNVSVEGEDDYIF